MKKRIDRYSIAFAILAVFIVTGCSEGVNTTQPIKYNHKIHLEDAGLNCFDCHKRVLAHEKASIPNIEICKDCHEQPMTESKEEKKLVEYIRKNQQIPWIQVHRVPDHAYFSHRRHVSIGKVACLTCHGNVPAMTLPFSKPYLPIKMAFCIDCHVKKHVNTDCATCHR
ncbi:MAG: hypothetical protein AUK27_12580 [Deltaproteobacteria bacterium CG2_30_66_27]|nr:MAG: hypothetical protein AUK27_12580 [Deltaproteobacteria bacterium CG2_30_66_27]